MHTQVNEREVSQIAHSTPTAEAIAHMLAVRQRDRESTDLRRFKMRMGKEGFNVDMPEFLKFWRDLEAKGYGKLVTGRRGGLNHFNWNVSLRKLGTAALKDGHKAPVERRTTPVPLTARAKTVVVMLKGGKSARIDLPTEMDNEERELVKKVLATAF